MPEIVIVGASGFGRELRQYLLDTYRDSEEISFKGFLDDDPQKLDQDGNGDSLILPVIGDTNTYAIMPQDRFLVAIGNPQQRCVLIDRLQQKGAQFLTLVHPLAYVAESAELGEGCIVGPFASVGAHAQVGEQVLINLYSTVGHDCRIGKCTVFSPYAVANGGSQIGSQVFLGSHAVVTPTVKVEDSCKIAAGSVVYRHVPRHSMVTGNPAKATPLRNSAPLSAKNPKVKTSDA